MQIVESSTMRTAHETMLRTKKQEMRPFGGKTILTFVVAQSWKPADLIKVIEEAKAVANLADEDEVGSRILIN